MADDRTALESEVRHFHALFFRRPLPGPVVERYVAANHLCFPTLEPKARAMVETIVTRRLDAEAIELALRLRKGNRVLTRKIQILFYLVEVRSEYYAYFINQVPGWWTAVLRLLGAVVRTGWKCAKGLYLVWRYDFV
ncbi:MAG: hypothetical protein ABSF62_22100 [Bryobacteraceae bacterium]|jgi:hypothetical protein